jgi:choline kinase
MNAVVLAAGTGSRLVDLTRDIPKALIPVNGIPLIQHSLTFVRALGCENVFVVGGFYYEKLRAHLDHEDGITLVENRQFLKGSILSLTKALPHVKHSFLLLNVDHIYPKRLAASFSGSRLFQNNITAFVDFDRPLREDDMKVQLNSKQEVERISKNLREFDGGYIGLTYVPEDLLERYKEVAMRIERTNEDSSAEAVLQAFADLQVGPSIFDTSGIQWLEVDNHQDLQNAERILRRVPHFLD